MSCDASDGMCCLAPTSVKCSSLDLLGHWCILGARTRILVVSSCRRGLADAFHGTQEHEGWLWKRQRSSFLGNVKYQRRWFILQFVSGGFLPVTVFLQYFDSKDKADKRDDLDFDRKRCCPLQLSYRPRCASSTPAAARARHLLLIGPRLSLAASSLSLDTCFLSVVVVSLVSYSLASLLSHFPRSVHGRIFS